jgi:GntR family transcriptional repressor for pyruvate dehydrogenase complex
MGVGLAVIREAVQRLVALNVLEASHGSGTVIRPFRWMPLIYDPTLFHLAAQRIGVRDLWEARRLLEGQVIRLAAERATRDDLAGMRRVLDKAEPLPSDYAASQSLNREFHLALAKAAKNAVMEDLVAPLLDMRYEGADRHFDLEHSRKTWQAHRQIYEAVAAGDLAAADQAIERHFAVGPIALAEIDARRRAAKSVRRPAGIRR